MAFLTKLVELISSNLLPFVVLVVVIIFVHEMGHFLVARRCGVRVEAFSVGIGKELFHWYDRYGTRWRIALLPIGGYVKFMGDKDAASEPDGGAAAEMTPEERAQTLGGRPLHQRAAIVAAGPIANFLLAILLFGGDAYINGTQALKPTVEDVVAGSPAQAAGLRSGDRVLAVGGESVESFPELQAIIAANPGKPITLTINRGSAELPVTITPETRSIKGVLGANKVGVIGIKISRSEDNIKATEYDVVEAVAYGTKQTGRVLRDSFHGVLLLLLGSGDIAGPFTIAEISGDVAKQGASAFIRLIAVLSVSIGFMNLLPIPILDGGHLMFYALEAVRGRPLGARAQEYCFRVGMALVLSLMIVGLASDYLRNFPL